MLCSINTYTWNPSLPTQPSPPSSEFPFPEELLKDGTFQTGKFGHENKLGEGMELNTTGLVSGRAEDLVPPLHPPPPHPPVHEELN